MRFVERRRERRRLGWRRSVLRNRRWHNRNCGGEPGNARRPRNRFVGGGIRAKQHFHAAQVDGLAWLQRGLGHQDPIDEGPIGGAKVFDDDVAAIDDNAAMRTGDGGIGDFEIIGKPAANGISTGLEFNFPSRW